MSRRSRNSRAWRSVWSGIRRDADAKTLVLPSESDEWGCERLQVSVRVRAGREQPDTFKASETALNVIYAHQTNRESTDMQCSLPVVVLLEIGEAEKKKDYNCHTHDLLYLCCVVQ